jgi:hypothetical protein
LEPNGLTSNSNLAPLAIKHFGLQTDKMKNFELSFFTASIRFTYLNLNFLINYGQIIKSSVCFQQYSPQ